VGVAGLILSTDLYLVPRLRTIAANPSSGAVWKDTSHLQESAGDHVTWEVSGSLDSTARHLVSLCEWNANANEDVSWHCHGNVAPQILLTQQHSQWGSPMSARGSNRCCADRSVLTGWLAASGHWFTFVLNPITITECSGVLLQNPHGSSVKKNPSF